MSIKKILVSQPKPTSEKSPYFDLEKKYGVEVVFRPFIKVEGLTSREFRQSKINVPDTLKYFCVSETIAHYLQKYVIYRKRKIFYSETGRMEDLIPIIAKHHKETYLMPVSDVHNDKAVVLDNNKVKYVKAVMYRTVSNDFKPGETLDYDMLVFFTPAGIKSYTTNFPDYKERNVVIAAMGQTTLEAAEKAGIKVDVTITPEAPSMAGAIDQYLKKVRAEEEKQERKAAREAAKKGKAGQDTAAKRSTAAKKAVASRRAKSATPAMPKAATGFAAGQVDATPPVKKPSVKSEIKK